MRRCPPGRGDGHDRDGTIANPAQPGQGPLRVLRPALADRDEVAPTCAQQKASTTVPSFTWAMAWYAEAARQIRLLVCYFGRMV